MFHTITHKMKGQKPGWLIDDVHRKMMNIVSNDDTYKKRSEQNKKNRRGGSLDNVVEPTHYQGSISAVQHAKRMATKNKGQLPTAHELFMKTHFKEVPGKGMVPANVKSKNIAESYQKKVEEATTQGIKKSPNELYWETVGGRNKKGRVGGLGESASLYYGERMGRVSRSPQQYTPSVVSQMQDQMEHRVEALRSEIRSELRSEIRSELRSEMEVEMQAQIRAEVAQMERRAEERWNDFISRFGNNTDGCSTMKPQRRDPRDDSGSGGASQGTPAVFQLSLGLCSMDKNLI
ncbi:uncharacterized protein LOC110722582 [Chenopodium quinoa]|uniref:uncharacterized protein LOC110722582 n=1 Tax=Chenopodium quinoa TaxID=63459 RepID=UPI000B76FF73|nr:uncharacterized protein LOC110722582 [Chenopodium quinoa]